MFVSCMHESNHITDMKQKIIWEFFLCISLNIQHKHTQKCFQIKAAYLNKIRFMLGMKFLEDKTF
jgi:hypothetical protein